MPVYGNKKPVLLVDGYNLIRSSGAYDDIAGDDFDSDPINEAREKVIADVATFAQGKYEATVVFDGGGNVNSEGEPMHTAGITVIFSPADTDADQVIERLAFKARKDEREVLVISSDWAVQNATFKDGVTRMSSIGFTHEMDEVREEYIESSNNHGKMTVGSRLDPETRAKLEAMARGEE
ncbi:MAG: NYN domain-containing protein [Coriobacteriales bacterium]